MLIRKRIYKSIGFKVIIFYILLSFISLSFIISIIFENQVDLIGKNTMLESEKQISHLIGAMKKFAIEMKKGSLFKSGTESEADSQLLKVVNSHFSDYIIFSEKNFILHKSSPDISIPETYKEDGLRAITSSAFSGKDYYLRINERDRLVYFYIPLNEFIPGNSILLIKKDIGSLNKSLNDLYKQMVYVILVVVFFHLIFAGVLYRLFIIPLNRLSEAALKIAAGDMNARVEMEGKSYEFDSIAEAFNNMAESIDDNVKNLSSEIETVRNINRRRNKNATRDELTGLLNDNYLTERIDDKLKLAKVKRRAFSLIIIDIDDFSKIISLYGKQTGDIIILETARVITGNCASSDIIARIGAEEFAILLPDAEEKNILEFAENIRISVAENQIVTPDGRLSVTVSIGASYINTDVLQNIESKDDVINTAQSLLIKAKTGGKNRVEFSS